MDWSAHAQIPSGSYTVRDLWNQEDLESIQVGEEAGEEVFIGTLDVHDNWAFKLTPLTGDGETTTTDSAGFNRASLITCFLLPFSVWKIRTAAL